MICSGKCKVHCQEDFVGMRCAGKLAAEVLDFITPYVLVGATTESINQLCHNRIIQAGAQSATLNYHGYPKSVCISINEVICHGIPGERKLADGDILNIDVTVILNGWFGDSSRMYTVGGISDQAKKLIDTAYYAMMAGINVIAPGAHLGDVGNAIEASAKNNKFSVVKDFCGHGIGRVFHDFPNVLNYGNKNTGVKLVYGNFFTVEPMINAGKFKSKVLKDGWTAVTCDGSLSAQFEHTVGVTENSVEIFTLSPSGFTKPPYIL